MQEALHGRGELEEEGRGEGREDGDGHDDGVEKRPRDGQGLAQTGDDEGELPHLGLRGRRRQGESQPLARRQTADGEEEKLAHDGNDAQQQDGQDVLHDHGGLDHEAHGDEENGPEEILTGRDQMLHPLGVDGPGQEGAGQERAQLRGQADLFRQHRHEEAQAQGEDEQDLVVHEAHQLFHHRGDQIDAQNQPQGKVQQQQADALGQGKAADGLGHGDGGEDDHGENGDDVFDDQGAHGQIGEGFFF